MLACTRYGSIKAVSLGSQTVRARTNPKSEIVAFGLLALMIVLLVR